MSKKYNGCGARSQRRRPGALAALLLLSVFTTPVLAQQGNESYPAAYFAANQPATAQDMVQLVPGFQIKSGDSNVRGFSGTVGNVLIDGQLPTSKEESVNDLLGRISASQVDHIELIRGAADMHGFNVLVNVVRKKSDTAIKGRVVLEEATTHFGASEPKAQLHVSAQALGGNTDLSLQWQSADIGSQNQNGSGMRERFNAAGALIYQSVYNFPRYTNSAEASLAHRRPLFGGDLSMGLAYKQNRNYSGISEFITIPSVSTATGQDIAAVKNVEARMDYKHGLGGWGDLQVFAVHRLTDEEDTSLSTTTVTNFSRALFHTREDVARVAWHDAIGPLKLEAGAEGAINVLSSHSTLTLAGVPTILPAANIRLEEQRVELFSTVNWRLTPTLMTEVGLRNETSTLTQTGDSSLVKDLTFFKPRWLTTWNPFAGNEFRILIERQVGQLVFKNFASSTSLNQNLLTAGNKNLEPARAWNFSAEWETHFWKRASAVLEIKREYISHVVDYVPVFKGATAFNAVGNIGSGVRDGAQLRVILPLDEIGLEGVTINGEAQAHHSKVRDPATGQFRQIVGGQTVNGAQFVFEELGGVTWDLPRENLQLGLNLHTHGNSHEADYRIDEIDPNHHGFKLGLFAEWKPMPGWTIRVFGDDLAQTAAYRDRILYTGLRGSSPLNYHEVRQLSNGSQLGMNLQYDF